MSAPQSFSHYPNIPPPLRVALTTLPEQPCPYLPGRKSTLRAVAASTIDPTIYQRFMDAAFRRSGHMVYQPVCVGCRECRPIRLAVDQFKPSKSQRRAWNRNADITTHVGPPTATSERLALYAAYTAHWHQSAEPATWRGLVDFLYNSPTRTLEFAHRLNGKLIAVGICDVTDDAISSVYFYFDPTLAKRSLGTFGAIAEIEHARQHGLRHYYLGYWIRDCAAMTYKANYGPAEVLDGDGVWRPLEAMTAELAKLTSS